MQWPLLFVTTGVGTVLMVAFTSYIWVDGSFDRRERATSGLFTVAMLAFAVASAGGDPVLGISVPEWAQTGALGGEVLFVALGVAVNYLLGRFDAEADADEDADAA